MSSTLPQFAQILGQDHAVQTLTTAYRVNRLPHGLIFAGPAGVGKGTTALALAALFLCEKPKDIAPCGKCESCVVLAAGNHPDYHLIYRQLARIEKQDRVARDLSVNVIREFLLEKAANKSVVGVGKVFVVEEADLMNATAQNALLKTLEEPSGRTLIILLTESPDTLLATIRSRCRLVQFVPLDEALIRDQLMKRSVSRDDAAKAAKYADGSLGLALRWLEDGVIERAAELDGLMERAAAGKAGAELADWFKASAEAYAQSQLTRDPQASKDQATREGMVLYFKFASQHFRRRLPQMDDPEAMERTCAAIDSVIRAEGFVESNVNIALVLQEFSGSLQRALSGEGV
jgi:DNA polymerase-3 subunit delta'